MKQAGASLKARQSDHEHSHERETVAQESAKETDKHVWFLPLGRNNVLFVRSLRETISFFPKDITGLIISVAKEHEDKIREFVSENKLPVQIILRLF